MLCFSIFILTCVCLQLPSAYSQKRVDVKPHPDELRLRRSLSEVEIVTPVRLSDDLQHVASSQHFRRRKRSFLSTSFSASDEEDFFNPVYKIHAFDEDLLVRLKPDADLVAPAFTTTLSWKNQTFQETEREEESFLRHCFYTGVVLGRPSSQVALSNCNGLTGSIYTDDFHLFIEPVARNFTSDQAVPHRIVRRSVKARSKRSSPGAHSSSCGVNDARHSTTYRRTFMSSIEQLAENVVNQARAKRSVQVSHEKNVIDFELEQEAEPKSRSKRSFDSRQHYVETMVVADASMAREHGDDLEHYILSIMMVANRVFSHPSLGSAIALSVVKIMVINNEADGPRVSSNAAHTLREFCLWQKAYNSPDDTDPEHHDLAILMTKQDLCGGSCDTLGMAEVGAMCSTRSSCAIVEDDGLSASYTLAHEVGHVLNMMHDDNRMCRENFANIDSDSHVMSSTMDRVDSQQPWSLCSRQAVIDFLQDGRGDCLLDRPQQPKVYPKDLPGAMYDVNSQCAMAFGTGAVECPYMRECGRLWCQLPSGTRTNQCHTRNFPRADGSPCSPGNHCMQGKCIRKGPQLAPVDGGWGSWSQYGSCSRSCGGGVQMSSRQCNNPAPRNGGKFCIGSRLQFRSCNTKKCPSRNGKEPRDFRSEQCASYNGQRFPLLGVRVASTWIPKYNDVHSNDRCKLICQSVETGTYITLSDRVVDGTRCGPDTTDICVRGQCMPAGCDGILSSKAKYNRCGLCNESNKRCKRVRGKYNSRQSGYNDVVTLPEGAASIKIQQRGFHNQIYDGNYLALVNSEGRYLLNGALTLSTIKKDIEVNGTFLQYSGVRVPIEKIHSTMPLKEPIKLQVLSLGLAGSKILPPRIKYSYYIPKPKTSIRRSKISGNVPRGGATLINRLNLGPEPSIRPRSSRPQDPHAAQNEAERWVTGRWGKCKVYRNRKCGPGWKKRKVTCKTGKRRTNGCDASLKPYHRLPCFVPDCPTATPIRKPGSPISLGRNNHGPSIVNRQNIQNNDRPVWNAGMWSPCSASCGMGIKRRYVMCETKAGRLLDDKMCDNKMRPSSSHGCQLPDCR